MTRAAVSGPFEPRILAFLCQWCGYAGADLAGVSRFRYPHNIRVVRVMCSGRVDAAFIMDAFLKGMDGVMVIGCHPGDCHYGTGNYEAMHMATAARLLMAHAGVDSRRFLLDWVSASEGARFSKLVTDFTAAITALGPLGNARTEDDAGLRHGLEAALCVAQEEKLRYLLGMFTTFTRKGNHYGEKYTEHEMKRALEGLIADEMISARIVGLLRDGPLSVMEMSEKLRQPSQRVLRLVMNMKRKGILAGAGTSGTAPKYSVAMERKTADVR